MLKYNRFHHTIAINSSVGKRLDIKFYKAFKLLLFLITLSFHHLGFFNTSDISIIQKFKLIVQDYISM